MIIATTMTSETLFRQSLCDDITCAFPSEAVLRNLNGHIANFFNCTYFQHHFQTQIYLHIYMYHIIRTVVKMRKTEFSGFLSPHSKMCKNLIVKNFKKKNTPKRLISRIRSAVSQNVSADYAQWHILRS